ncbi:MAG TPA: molybdenum cofactor biosynthesis protein MoaE [Acidimicrobiales bacterium]|nr:molybdenum cofactor biosynthesis protein MoaE [Acidimicrobiales bacterium]
MLQPPETGDDWIGLDEAPLPVAEAVAWSVLPSCGGQVLFTGTVRDSADGRDDVTGLEYEAYQEQVAPRLQAIADAARTRWPDLGRLVLLHRTGRLRLGEVSVVVVASAPHRGEAFEAARYCIDTLKATAPIWKREEWAGGSDWGTRAQPVQDVRNA